MWKRFFMILGIIFFVLILFALAVFVYVWMTKPFGVDPTKVPGALTGSEEQTESSYDHPGLSTEQEVFLENIGVDTSQIPTQITAEQEACATEKLGEERVAEIKAGAALRASDYVKAGSCFQ